MELDLLPVFMIKASGILISHPFFDVYIYLGILAMAFASANWDLTITSLNTLQSNSNTP